MSTNAYNRPAEALRSGDKPVTAPPSAGAKKLGGVAGWVR